MVRPTGNGEGHRGRSGETEAKLRALIEDKLRPGDKLPSERDLAQELSVSRPTLREVISSMCRTGELDRRWGLGTFVPVSVRKFRFTLGGTRPLRLAALEQGFRADFTNFETDLVLADLQTSGVLDIAEGSYVWSVKRTLELDGRAVAHISDFVKSEINGTAIDLSGLGKEGQVDLLTYLAKVASVQIELLDLVLGVTLASSDFARIFAVETSSPLMTSRVIGRRSTGDAVTCGAVYYVPGRVELFLNARGDDSVASP